MKSIADICVVGTDTGAGKTVVSLLLMQWFLARGYSPFYLKPFQTGCSNPYDTDSDAAFIYRYTPALRSSDPDHSVIFCYPNPKAPFYAARDAGQRIDVEEVIRRIRKKRATYAPLVIEAAGGLLVPVTEDKMVADLIPAFDCRPILVARAGLGTINHTLLSIEALKKRGAAPTGVILVQTNSTADDPDLAEENMAAIEAYAGIRVGGVVPAIADFNAPPSGAYQPLEKLFL